MTSTFSTCCANQTTREAFETFASTDTYVNTDESALKMFNLLKDKKYSSGDQIDFFDR